MHPNIKIIERKVKGDKVLVIVPTGHVLPTTWAIDCSMHGVPLGTRQQFLFVSAKSVGDAVNYGLGQAQQMEQDFALVMLPGHKPLVWMGHTGSGVLHLLKTMHNFEDQVDVLSPSPPGEFDHHILRVDRGQTGFFMMRMSVLHRLDVFVEEYIAPVEGMEINLRRYLVDDDFGEGGHFAELLRKSGVPWWQHRGVQCVQLVEGEHYADGYVTEESSEPSVLLAS